MSSSFSGRPPRSSFVARYGARRRAHQPSPRRAPAASADDRAASCARLRHEQQQHAARPAAASPRNSAVVDARHELQRDEQTRRARRRAVGRSRTCGAAPRTPTASTPSTAAPCACSARSGRARTRRRCPRSRRPPRLPVRSRASTKMPAPDSDDAAEQHQVVHEHRRHAGPEQRRARAALRPASRPRSVSVRALGIEDVAVEAARGGA